MFAFDFRAKSEILKGRTKCILDEEVIYSGPRTPLFRRSCQQNCFIMVAFLAGDSKHSNICLLGSGDTIKLSCNEQIAYKERCKKNATHIP